MKLELEKEKKAKGICYFFIFLYILLHVRLQYYYDLLNANSLMNRVLTGYGKTCKVMKLTHFIFQVWKVMEFNIIYCQSSKVMEN